MLRVLRRMSIHRWSRGYHTRNWIRGSRVQIRPGWMNFFQSVKILSMTSFEREVKPRVPCRRFTARKKTSDHLFGIMVSTSDYPPRGPGFDSRLYPRNFSGSIGSGTGSTQPREENWVSTWMRSSEIRLRKLKLRLRNKRFANHKVSCNAIWQKLLQSVLALRGCSATDLRKKNLKPKL